jgi:hypothetical protein
MAEIDNMNELKICLVSSDSRELAKLMHEQYRATHAHHLSLIMRPHILKIIPKMFI